MYNYKEDLGFMPEHIFNKRTGENVRVRFHINRRSNGDIFLRVIPLDHSNQFLFSVLSLRFFKKSASSRGDSIIIEQEHPCFLNAFKAALGNYTTCYGELITKQLKEENQTKNPIFIITI